MGITGLLPFLKSSCRPANIRNYSGSTVAIDAYSWLHRGSYSCALQLAVKNEKADGYVNYCIKMINMLLDAGVKPIMVFDGCNLPSKAGTEKKRRENREMSRERGKVFYSEGRIGEATKCFQKCVDITPEMALEVIQACKKKGVDCIVAPYEADAQLAYLSKTNIADIVISEDSDLVLFGCEKILFKMDSYGEGIIYEKENLPKSFGANAEKMSFEKFRYMCILSGCDYLPSLPGIGLGKAFKVFKVTSNPDLYTVLSKVPFYLNMPRLVVTSDYKEAFRKADNTFLYQLVFCPQKKKLVPLNPYPEGMDFSEMEYAGKYFPDDLALQLAVGNINVKTLKKLDNLHPEQWNTNWKTILPTQNNSIWSSADPSSKNSSPKVNTCVAFKFKQNAIKVPAATPQKKRAFDQISEIESIDFTEQVEQLFSLYRENNSPSKPQEIKVVDVNENIKKEEIYNSKKTSFTAFIPFRKNLCTDTDKNVPALPSTKIMKSRFFTSAGDSESKIAEKCSLFDIIDQEYKIESATSASPTLDQIVRLPEKKESISSQIFGDSESKPSEKCSLFDSIDKGHKIKSTASASPTLDQIVRLSEKRKSISSLSVGDSESKISEKCTLFDSINKRNRITSATSASPTLDQIVRLSEKKESISSLSAVVSESKLSEKCSLFDSIDKGHKIKSATFASPTSDHVRLFEKQIENYFDKKESISLCKKPLFAIDKENQNVKRMTRFNFLQPKICNKKLNSSLGSDGNAFESSFDLAEEDLNETKRSLSCSEDLLRQDFKSSTPFAKKTVIYVDIADLPIKVNIESPLKDTKNLNYAEQSCTDSNTSQEKGRHTSVHSLDVTGPKISSKINKCRSIGLSKNHRPKGNMKGKIEKRGQDTLLNFNFIRQTESQTAVV